MNDLGGTWTGEGKSSKAADDVVALIGSNGGTAVANYGQTHSLTSYSHIYITYIIMYGLALREMVVSD